MMIHVAHQNTVAAQHSLNNAKTIRHDSENSDVDYKAVDRGKQHNIRSGSVRTAEFLEDLQKRVLEDSSNGIRVLSHELNVGLCGVANHCS